ncbi:MAG TPA: low affinity iron permease family protein [Gemmataceae bacterium]|nr:low affinity iron permease family protein [Gemmataceae bacterium]
MTKKSTPAPANLPVHHESFFARLARLATDWSGTTTALFLAILLLVVWAASYPLFDKFDTWQLVINTVTTIITFLMVFLIQRAQNKDSHAIHLKLNELVAAVEGASNRLINAENLSEEELKTLHAHYSKLLELARKDAHITEYHSVEEAVQRHEGKKRLHGSRAALRK